MSDTPARRTFEVRHVQLARAAFAALAAIMITFSSDHSAVVGLSVFSGFAIATGLVHLAAAWLVYPAGARWPSLLLGIVTIIAGMAGGLQPLRTVSGFLAVVVSWAVVTGVIEAVAGIRGIRALRPRELKSGEVAPWAGGPSPVVAPRSESRDAVVVGILTVIVGSRAAVRAERLRPAVHRRRGPPVVHPHGDHDRRRHLRRLRRDRRGVPGDRRLLPASAVSGPHRGSRRAEGSRVTDRPTRRDLMKPVQLLGLAFGSALFAGIVTLVSMGFFQQRFEGQAERALVVAAVVAGITFIVVLVVVALLLLAVDPAQVTKTVDRPVLVDKEEPDSQPDAGSGDDTKA